MMDALALVSDLRRQGVRFRWAGSEVRASGELSMLTSDYRRAVSEVREEFETLVRWETLQDESEASFGCPEARLYPFLRLTLTNAPVVRTSDGGARVVRVVPNGCDVVFETALREWERDCERQGRRLPLPPMTRLPLDAISPPTEPPSEVQFRGWIP